jgi:hypothetical protein
MTSHQTTSRNFDGRTLAVICLAAVFVQPVSVRAQPALDASLHTAWLQESDVYGVGGAVHFVFSGYALEIVPYGGYYFADDDSTSSWSMGLDGRVNLPALGPLRPYGGAGVVRLRQQDDSKWFFNAAAGAYLRIRGDRVFPFVEAAHRPGDDLNPWRFQAGLRFIMREP